MVGGSSLKVKYSELQDAHFPPVSQISLECGLARPRHKMHSTSLDHRHNH